jgi:D-alanyl-D-alanine carboxypeptidase
MGALTAASAGPRILFDVNTGEVFDHREAFRRWHPASVTKLMTAYTTFRAVEAGELRLDSPITVTRYAASKPPSKMGWKPGSTVSLDNALKIIMVKSANDIATAIGDNVGGSEKAFAARMNAESARLGMTGSHWVNASGLHDPAQYTTARDLAILVQAIRRDFPQHAEYFSIDGILVGKKVMKNFNTLMGRFEGADGMKTGFICPSGFNLAASATRDGRTLAAVVLGEMNAKVRAERAAIMLADGFEHPPQGSPKLLQLKPHGEKREETTDLRPVVCGGEAAQTASDAPEPAETLAAQPSLLVDLGGEKRIEKVGLGNAPGPYPKMFADAAGNPYADVPLPTWRPDMPPPPGWQPIGPETAQPATPPPEPAEPEAAQGDQAEVESPPAPSPTGKGDRLVRQRPS